MPQLDGHATEEDRMYAAIRAQAATIFAANPEMQA